MYTYEQSLESNTCILMSSPLNQTHVYLWAVPWIKHMYTYEQSLESNTCILMSSPLNQTHVYLWAVPWIKHMYTYEQSLETNTCILMRLTLIALSLVIKICSLTTSMKMLYVTLMSQLACFICTPGCVTSMRYLYPMEYYYICTVHPCLSAMSSSYHVLILVL